MAVKRRRSRRRNSWRGNKPKHRRVARKGWRKRKSRRRSVRRGYARPTRRKGSKRYKRWKNSSHRRRRNPRRRRRNYRQYVSNPRRRHRRRRNSMYSGHLYANPRRRRNSRHRRRNTHHRRRRNPGLGGTVGSIKSMLTSPGALMNLAVGAVGATLSDMLGTFLTSKIASFAPTTFVAGTMAGQLLGAATRIASALLIASFAPAKYKTAIVIGGGVMAAQPLVSGLLSPLLAPVKSALGLTGIAGPRGGIGAWVTAQQVYQGGQFHSHRGTNGMGAWLSAQQMPALGIAGLRGMGNYGPGSHPGSNYAAPAIGPASAFTM